MRGSGRERESLRNAPAGRVLSYKNTLGYVNNNNMFASAIRKINKARDPCQVPRTATKHVPVLISLNTLLSALRRHKLPPLPPPPPPPSCSQRPPWRRTAGKRAPLTSISKLSDGPGERGYRRQRDAPVRNPKTLYQLQIYIYIYIPYSTRLIIIVSFFFGFFATRL